MQAVHRVACFFFRARAAWGRTGSAPGCRSAVHTSPCGRPSGPSAPLAQICKQLPGIRKNTLSAAAKTPVQELRPGYPETLVSAVKKKHPPYRQNRWKPRQNKFHDEKKYFRYPADAPFLSDTEHHLPVQQVYGNGIIFR